MEDLNGQGSEQSECGCPCSGLGLNKWSKSRTVFQRDFRDVQLSHHYPIPHSLLVKDRKRNDTRDLSTAFVPAAEKNLQTTHVFHAVI